MTTRATVFVFQWSENTPVYHFPDWMLPGGGDPRPLEGGGVEYLTACGRAQTIWDPTSRTEWRHVAQRMRMDHAEAIGRPCAACAEKVAE